MYREILEKFARCFDLNIKFYKKPSPKTPSSLKSINSSLEPIYSKTSSRLKSIYNILEPIYPKIGEKGNLPVKSFTYVCLEKTREPSKMFARADNTLSFHNGLGFWQWSARGEDCEEASRNYVEGLILDESLEAMIIDSSRLGVVNIGKSFPRSGLEELLLFLDLCSQTD